MRISTLSLMILISSITIAQKAPINFESGGQGAGWTWTVFENATNPALEIITNPDQTGINTSVTVAKFTALQAGNPWAGVESAHGSADLGPFVLDATNSTIKIMVWKSVISDVGIKLVAASGWALPEIKVANTKVNQWEELTFNFASYQNPPTAEGQYDQIVIFPDYGTRTQDNIIYFDNITFNQAIVTPTEPDAPAPTPTRAAADVISLFSDAYTDVTVDTWRTVWSAANLEEITISGNATKKYSNLDFVGIETVANQINATEMTHFHIDVWSPNFTLFGIKLVDFGPDGAFGGGDDKEHQVNFNSPAQGEWISLDIPLTDFTGLTTRAHMAQYILSGQPTGTTTIFIDNVYFFKDGTTSVNDVEYNDLIAYPNPVNSGGLVKFDSTVQKIDLFDVNGKLIRSVNSTSVIGTDGLNKGMYIMTIHTMDGKVRSQRLIIN
jgi:hypothetical protein